MNRKRSGLNRTHNDPATPGPDTGRGGGDARLPGRASGSTSGSLSDTGTGADSSPGTGADFGVGMADGEGDSGRCDGMTGTGMGMDSGSSSDSGTADGASDAPHSDRANGPDLPPLPQPDRPLSVADRLLLQFEEFWQLLWGWIPGGPGRILRSWLYRPLFASAGPFRSGVGVVIQGFRHIRLGRGTGLNRHASLYASRGSITLGDRVFVGDFSSINANDAAIRIGNDVIIGPMCVIQGANHNFDRLDLPIARQGHRAARVIIEDNVWIAARAVILPGVRIASGVVIAAGAVVSRDVPANAVAGGVPARVLRYRGAHPRPSTANPREQA